MKKKAAARKTAKDRAKLAKAKPKAQAAPVAKAQAKAQATPVAKAAAVASAVEPQGFWDAFRRELGIAIKKEPLALNDEDVKLTPVVIRVAGAVCDQIGPGVRVQSAPRGGEEQVSWHCPERNRLISPSGLDVSAWLPGASRRAIAFESELAPLGWNGRTYLKTWLEEFAKLCQVDAELRVLSSYFLPGESSRFEETLRSVFKRFDSTIRGGKPGKWLLLFGSFESSREPHVPWLAFEWEIGNDRAEHSLKPLTGAFRPRRIALGQEEPSQ
jgi:hypothetical protein